MSDQEQVLEANRAFYQAFESLELEKMERVWLQAPHIVCVHPGWRRLSGWGPIMEAWERIFESTFEMKFDLTDVEVTLRGDLAVVVMQENLTQRGYDGITRSVVEATNVFERVGNRWYLVLHHGSPVAAPSEHDPPIQ
ncbi:MAG: nuclear transport factor 2 family protein [Candidatus Binataceae bacterium]|jgi:ketosteroid isomerase-like protein